MTVMSGHGVAYLEVLTAIGRDLTEAPKPEALWKHVEILMREKLGCSSVEVCPPDVRLRGSERAVVSMRPSTGFDSLGEEVEVRLVVGDRDFGTLRISWDEPINVSSEEAQLLEIMGGQVALAIAVTGRSHEADSRIAAMKLLHEITKDIVSRLEVEDVIAAILRVAAQGLDGLGADILVYEPNTSEWRVFAEYNTPRSYSGLIIEPSEFLGPDVGAVLDGRAVVANEFGKWIAQLPSAATFSQTEEEWAFWEATSCVSAPLCRDGEVVGMLSVFDSGRSHKFSQEDADFLTLFTDTASVALVNAELYSETRRASAELEQRVKERTRQLARANKELADKTKQLHRAFDATIRVQEEERARIGRELHDTSHQMVAGALYELQAAHESLSQGRLEITEQKIDAAMRLVTDIDAENRKVIEAAYPSLLRRRGLAVALAQEVRVHQGLRDGICTLEIVGDIPRLPSREELAIFRVAQEALANAVKHSHASKVVVRLRFEENELIMSVEDDGVGFDPAAGTPDSRSHLGLISMRDRVESINAHLAIESAPGCGAKLSFRLSIGSRPAE